MKTVNWKEKVPSTISSQNKINFSVLLSLQGTETQSGLTACYKMQSKTKMDFNIGTGQNLMYFGSATCHICAQ